MCMCVGRACSDNWVVKLGDDDTVYGAKHVQFIPV
jgi:hypothetical protein